MKEKGEKKVKVREEARTRVMVREKAKSSQTLVLSFSPLLLVE
jgi:hypothetical protein